MEQTVSAGFDGRDGRIGRIVGREAAQYKHQPHTDDARWFSNATLSPSTWRQHMADRELDQSAGPSVLLDARSRPGPLDGFAGANLSAWVMAARPKTLSL